MTNKQAAIEKACKWAEIVGKMKAAQPLATGCKR